MEDRTKIKQKLILAGIIGHGVTTKDEMIIASLEALHECKVIIVGEDSDKKEITELEALVKMRNLEVRQRLEVEKLQDHTPLCDSVKSIRNYEKQNSQSGWKNRPKHKR